MIQSVSKVQSDLKATMCPCCSSGGSLAAILRCDLQEKDCMVTIQCDQCRLIFNLLDEPGVGTPVLRSGNKCPSCNEKTSNYNILCEVTSRECHYSPAGCDECVRKELKQSAVTAA